MIIYGAGMAGLLAANSLRRFKPVIKEAQSALPNNHSALLRFRTANVGATCGIPFKKVNVTKAISYEKKLHTTPTIFFSNLYSGKVTGAVESRSINDIDISERYIAPLNLVELMAGNCDIEYDATLSADMLPFDNTVPVISTIPMPVIMKIVGWHNIPEFKFKKIWTQSGIIDEPDVSVYQTIYYPDPMATHYRISVIGNVVIAEHSKKPEFAPGPVLMGALRDDFGINATRIADIKSSEQKYGKILPIDERLRKEFIFHLTKEHGIYSLGRFATWRQLLLDDIVDDVAVIEKFIESDAVYDISLHSK
ncbi:MAG: hypothetical protein CMB80_01710 [Flammeovirgaceae bacterium]|nr:hypothetical protein [Flammeovirgaceae bacterium]